MLLALAVAHAACSVQETPTATGRRLQVTALSEPVECRTLTLSAVGPLEVRAERVDRYTRRHRLGPDRVVEVAGGAWKVGAPELAVGDTLRVEVAVDSALTVTLADVPPPLPRGTWVDESWEVRLDPRHPGWGFADPRLAETVVSARVRVFEDAGPVALPVPLDARGLVAEPPASVARGRVDLSPGTVTALRWTIAGAQPLGARRIPPGSFTLRVPGAELVASASPGVTVRELPGGVRFDAPTGGEVRWRVVRVGPEPVVTDAELYARGLDWRFSRVSLPEPAVPVRLKGLNDPEAMLAALWEEVQSRHDAALPEVDPLRPRALNRAWRSGWATSVEKALILQRLLAQEKIPARWVLTGAEADRATLTGLDRMLLLADLGGEERWLDPACRTCAPGEIDPRWMGRPAIGAAEEIPRAPGTLELEHRPGADPRSTVTATGAARRWLIALAAECEPAQLGRAWARALGLGEAELLSRADADGRLVLEFRGEGHAGPLDLPGGEPTWEGGRTLRVIGPAPAEAPTRPAPAPAE